MCSAQSQLRALLAAGTIAIGTLAAVVADAAELKVLSASALKPVLPELAEAFGRESGHKVTLAFATAGEVEKRVVAGEAVDLVVVTDIAADRLIGQGFVPQGAQSVVARVGVGIGVREGAAKPDIGSTDALKQTLLSAKSVTYPDPARGGASGIHFNTVIERHGQAEGRAGRQSGFRLRRRGQGRGGDVRAPDQRDHARQGRDAGRPLAQGRAACDDICRGRLCASC